MKNIDDFIQDIKKFWKEKQQTEHFNSLTNVS